MDKIYEEFQAKKQQNHGSTQGTEDLMALLSTEKCVSTGCNARALNGSAYCYACGQYQ